MLECPLNLASACGAGHDWRGLVHLSYSDFAAAVLFE
jgi:hypothetical protein